MHTIDKQENVFMSKILKDDNRITADDKYFKAMFGSRKIWGKMRGKENTKEK